MIYTEWVILCKLFGAFAGRARAYHLFEEELERIERKLEELRPKLKEAGKK